MHAAPVRNGRILRTVLIATIAAALHGGFATGTARADDGDTFEQGIIRSLMRGLGLRDSREEGIIYRERAPLVVPPTRDLPPPETRPLSQSNPAWPSDPDVNRAAEARRRAKLPRKDAVERAHEEAKPLSPAELEKGRTASRSTPTSPSADPDRSVMRPSELGYQGGLFGALWSKVGPAKDEVGVFKGEPERSSLTAPPAGYQTPSPSQPYGVTAAKDPNERVNRALQDRSSGAIYQPN